MKINAIITGSTGMVGKGVLLECLENQAVEKVLLINRHPVGIEHEKIKEIIHQDFFDLSPIRQEMKGYQACFFCLGVSSVGMSEEKYHQLTYDLTIHFAETVLLENPQMVFCYVSGAGTDSSEKGRMMWARVKGKTENKIKSMGFRDVYLFRPGFIQPMKGIRSKTKWYNILYQIVNPFYPLLKKLFPSYITNTSLVGKAMIQVACVSHQDKYLENKDINQIAGKID